MISEHAVARLLATRSMLENAVACGNKIYGVNTGFGALSETEIANHELRQLQNNLLRSHAIGVGPVFDETIVRVLLLLRAHTLSLGASGVSPNVPKALLNFLNLGIIPVVPSQGSVGASGDLAPLAHLALPLIGEGEVFWKNRRLPASQVLSTLSIAPLELGAKEGLSLINGTQVSSGITALALLNACELIQTADIIGALSLDASLGTATICDPRIHAGKPHNGQIQSANNIAQLLVDSRLNQSHAACGRIQDAYSFRCMPQVHGSVRQAIQYALSAVQVEINSFTDNPLILDRPEGGFDVISGGNFHAAAVALPADHCAAALTTLATISERRLDRFMNSSTSNGLPAFLANNPGLESGFMMAQVTASALASECKAMSFPASVDTIPTSAGKEDHVSMGPIAARKFKVITRNVAHVLSIEAAIAARALDLREFPTSPALVRVHNAIRKHVAPFDGDRSMTYEIEALASSILDGDLRRAAGLPHEIHGFIE